MERRLLLSSLFIFILGTRCLSQTNDSTAVVEQPKFKISGYVDAYYAYYTDSVGTGNFQKFPSVSPISNQFGLNTAQLSFLYDAQKVRAAVTLHYGDIARSAWSSTLNNVMEAHAGIRLSKKFWLDAGLFRTHFGTEGLLPKENFLSSVSVNTFYEPYFEAGARLNYIPNEKWSINIYALNGYNLIEDNNKKKSLGMLVTYAFNDAMNIGYSNYVGDDSPETDSIPHLRIHQNIFLNCQVKKLKIQIGGDYCVQQNTDLIYNKNISATMVSGVASFKYQLKDKWAISARGEGFSDPQGFMSGVILNTRNKNTGLKLWGVTVGAEYKPTAESYIRIEGRQLQMEKIQEIFYWKGKNITSRLELTCNMGISF